MRGIIAQLVWLTGEVRAMQVRNNPEPRGGNINPPLDRAPHGYKTKCDMATLKVVESDVTLDKKL